MDTSLRLDRLCPHLLAGGIHLPEAHIFDCDLADGLRLALQAHLQARGPVRPGREPGQGHGDLLFII